MTTQLIDSLAGRSPAARRVSIRNPDAPSSQHSPPALDLDTLSDIVVGLGQVEGLWRPHVDHDPLGRTSVRLVATEVYEVWLLGWTSGQRVELHDHGGANAAFVVLDGELDEITLGLAGTSTKRLRPADVGTVPAGAIHDVVNAGPIDATSLHVYSDPLQTMTFFDPDGNRRHTEVVEQVPALLTSAVQARALHPSRRR